MTACAFVTAISNAILNPLAALIFGAGLLVFVFGIVEFMGGLATDSEAKEKGKQHMLWGILGMAIMLSAYAILKVVAGTFGLAIQSC